VYKYNVSGTNGTCLLASMGLQLNVTYKKKDNTTVTGVFSINPNKTTAGGSCSPQLVTLELRSESIPLLAFQFGMNTSTSRYFLQGIQLNMTLPDARGKTPITPLPDQVPRSTHSHLPLQTPPSRPPTAL